MNLLQIFVLIVVGIFMVTSFIIYMSYKYWSDPNFPGGPRFFVKGKENKAMFVTFSGRFTGKVILPSRTVKITEDYKIIQGKNLKRKERTFLGMYWIGLWPFYKIHFRHQQWTEWESTPNGRRIRHRDEYTPYLIVKPFEYAMYLEDAEDSNGVPLGAWFTVILKPQNAYLPIFGNDDAYGQVQTLCLGEALMYIKRVTFSKLGKDEEGELDQDDFARQIINLNNRIIGRPDGLGIKEALGYEILDAKLNSIEITGEIKNDILKSTVLEYQAKEKAKAEIALAEGTKKALAIKAEGEKKAIILKAEGESEAIELKAKAEKIAGILNVDVEKYGMDQRKAFYDMLNVEGLEFAQQIELAKKIFADSSLTTYVGGKKVLPTLNVGGK